MHISPDDPAAGRPAFGGERGTAGDQEEDAPIHQRRRDLVNTTLDEADFLLLGTYSVAKLINLVAYLPVKIEILHSLGRLGTPLHESCQEKP
jgi:hypothetical protein